MSTTRGRSHQFDSSITISCILLSFYFLFESCQKDSDINLIDLCLFTSLLCTFFLLLFFSWTIYLFIFLKQKFLLSLFRYGLLIKRCMCGLKDMSSRIYGGNYVWKSLREREWELQMVWHLKNRSKEGCKSEVCPAAQRCVMRIFLVCHECFPIKSYSKILFTWEEWEKKLWKLI